jgi:outer membrane lipoprotein-sorting protein
VEIADAAKLKLEIKAHSEAIKSIKSDFVQEKNLSMLEEIVQSEGRFLFKKPGEIRWEYSKPFEYAIVVSNEKFLISNEGKISEFDISSNQMFRQISNMIVMAISGDFVDNKEFDIKFYENTNFYLAELNPYSQQIADMLSAIKIYFDKKSMDVKKLKFIEPGDDYTLIVFKNYQINIELSHSEFILN